MSQDDAAVALRGILPPSRRPSGSQISRMETGQIKDPQVYVVAALARVFQRPFEEIAPELIGEAIAVRTLLRDVIDLREQAEGTQTWYDAGRPNEPELPFPDDSDEPPKVIELRDRMMAQADENEPVELLRIAN